MVGGVLVERVVDMVLDQGRRYGKTSVPNVRFGSKANVRIRQSPLPTECPLSAKSRHHNTVQIGRQCSELLSASHAIVDVLLVVAHQLTIRRAVVLRQIIDYFVEVRLFTDEYVTHSF